MKQRILSVLLGLIFLILFNGMFFVLLDTVVSTAVWISYGFIHLAYIFVLVTPLLTVKTETAPILNYTIWSQTITYFIIELLLGIGFIIYAVYSHNDTITWPLLVQSIGLAIFLFILIANMMANEVTQKHEEQRVIDEANFDSLVDEIRCLQEEELEPEVKKIIAKCFSEMRYGPVRSHPSVAGIESDIKVRIGLIQDALSEDDHGCLPKQANELLKKIQERNRKLKFIH